MRQKEKTPLPDNQKKIGVLSSRAADKDTR